MTGATAAGVMAGAAIGGPIGAVAGGLIGLGIDVTQAIQGDRKAVSQANRRKRRLTRLIMDAATVDVNREVRQEAATVSAERAAFAQSGVSLLGVTEEVAKLTTFQSNLRRREIMRNALNEVNLVSATARSEKKAAREQSRTGLIKDAIGGVTAGFGAIGGATGSALTQIGTNPTSGGSSIVSGGRSGIFQNFASPGA